MSRSIFTSAAVAALALTTGATAQLFPLSNITSASTSMLGTVTSSLTSTSSGSTSSGSTSSGSIPGSSGVTSLTPGTGTTRTSSGTTSATTGSAAPTASDPVFCPALSGELYDGPLGVTYAISCDTNYGGILIDITIAIAKRQNAAVTSLDDCLTLCSTLDTCVATAFDTNNPECFFYSSIGEAFTANGFEFAKVADRDAVSSTTISSSTRSSNGTTAGVTSGSMKPTGSGGVSPGFTSTGSVPYPTSANGTSKATSATSATSGSAVSSSGSASGTATGSDTASGSGTATGSGVATGSGTTTGTAPGASSTGDSFCPALNGNIFIGNIGIQYLIECGVNHVGIIIDITIAKRQGTVNSLGDCIDQCDVNTACVATSYNTASNTCTLFSSVGAAFVDPDSEFAMVVAPATTATAGQQLTSTILSTTVRTISSCAPTVTDCPYAGGALVVTEVIPVSETTYICPTATSFAAGPVVCSSCPYSPVTATVYSQTVQTIYSCAPTVTDCPFNGVSTAGAYGSASAPAGSGVTTVVTTTVTPVTTVVVNSPQPTGSGSAVTTMVTASGSVGGSASVVTITAGESASAGTGSGSGSGSDSTPASETGAGSSAGSGSGSTEGAVTGSVTGATATGATATGSVVTQISDGQIQVPATAVNNGGASGTATGAKSTMSSYTGAASQLNVGAGMAGAVVAGLAFLL